MTDAPIVHIGENSPEEVAYKLMINVAIAEGKDTNNMRGFTYVLKSADRKWLLDTYAECLSTVKNPAGRLHSSKGSSSPGGKHAYDYDPLSE